MRKNFFCLFKDLLSVVYGVGVDVVVDICFKGDVEVIGIEDVVIVVFEKLGDMIVWFWEFEKDEYVEVVVVVGLDVEVIDKFVLIFDCKIGLMWSFKNF